MKVSEYTVKRVWMYWIKNRKPLPIKKFGRKSQELEEESVELILETHKKQKLGARRLESNSRFSLFLKENNIKHIKARVKHPQTNGKIEK
ncbi:MAG TPA: hypothetical protein PLM24_05490 [Methanothrix sp.]|nr:hypothetical protein [Methanothrix sp.]HPJ84509.1 hypothetical protein [Methanothrix sp.]HPR66573.1 hypothetical protein [Methanothrix sp.]